MNNLVSISVNKSTLSKMKEFYNDYLIPNNGEYVFFLAKRNDVIITGFISKKENSKVTFQGDNALEEARIWDKDAELYVAKEKVQEEWICFEDQIGSDEVGVGDFLLPMIVVAAYVNRFDIKKLIELGVHDSKKLTDEKILSIGEELVKTFKFSKLTLPNEKYNEMVLKGENLNSLKAKMHNRALLNMHEAYPEVVNIFVDQFCVPTTYYKYLNDQNEKQVKGITFKTKGESYFPCVALASVIARYSFLKEKEKLEEKYKTEFPFGASSIADSFAKKFIKKYGLEEFKKIAKANFKNFDEAVQEKLI